VDYKAQHYIEYGGGLAKPNEVIDSTFLGRLNPKPPPVFEISSFLRTYFLHYTFAFTTLTSTKPRSPWNA